MALTRSRIGTNEDGTPHYHYQSDGHVVWTGPHSSGVVTLADGTEYEVSPACIEVASPEHAAEVSHLIGQQLAENGHPLAPGFDPANPDVDHSKKGR